ncbi:helix-turn-helix domain-containing protein [Morganella morganii]|jgi:transcriptional regulator with XRE-family HTH domain|uniref:Helix-turn-helix transcriptional regulator n=2 Tax=Morganellaceae TaxID=1903414 RepID=A0AAN5S1H0_MORMO|nr:XRE family transcriptional regulator [Salmonella enterica subsp. enterica serovar Typhimurium]ECG4848275.1 XRE family transcriptional regulator [Salmonella enterica subsp. enterica serovar Newport]HAT3810652.1 helix-turn-helix transcriptional regulator [Morganella morganii]
MNKNNVMNQVPVNITSRVGRRIKEMRVHRNMSVKKLADMLYVSKNTIHSYESGKEQISIDAIHKLSFLFNCNINDFFTESLVTNQNNDIKNNNEISQMIINYFRSESFMKMM